MKKEIETELAKLVGLKLQYAGRASNLFWLGIGDKVQITRRNRIVDTAEYAINIQCSWRITLKDRIIVASRDFYYPNSELVKNSEGFDWDIKGNNRFDERISSFINDNERLMVEQVKADEVGGLVINLSNGYKLEVFPDSSQQDEDNEYWRLFNRKENSPHFIVNGKGIDRV